MDQLNTVREEYTAISQGRNADTGNWVHNVWLKVGGQTFFTTPEPFDTREEAEAFRELLANALLQMVKEQQT